MLGEAPFDEALAGRAYRRAVAAGDRDLALNAARALLSGGALPPDGEFLFLIQAIDDGDWAEARGVVDRIDAQQVFQSLTPLFRSWIAFGAHDEDPFAILSAAPEAYETSTYAQEQRALLLIARGNYEEGVAAVQALQGLSPAGIVRVHLAAAATLADKRQRDLALSLLDGDNRAYNAARELIERRRTVPGVVETAGQGIAQILVRLASDVSRRNVDELALTLGRYAEFLAPDNGIAHLVTAAILGSDQQYNAALESLGRVDPADPYFAEAEDMRVRLLVDQGATEDALALARSRADRRDPGAGDWLRVGTLYTELERHDDAVAAYDRALELDRADEGAGSWTTWLQYGGALSDAGRWDDARTALDRALELAPEEPLILNYLGYALLERREQLDRAEELIRKASELQPENAAITDSLGWVQYVRGDVATAIGTLERASLGDPAEPTINEHLGDAYWTAGRRRDARFAWRAALVSAEDQAASRIESKLDFGLTPETASP